VVFFVRSSSSIPRRHHIRLSPGINVLARNQGETLTPYVRDTSLSLVSSASQLLVLGTSLATYSAFRLVKQAAESGKKVLMISLGPSRADRLAGVDKMERKAGDVLRTYLDEVVK
jgi:NAD-dependent SIR2 family protein deacetylase